jgi:transmembrane sensor
MHETRLSRLFLLHIKQLATPDEEEELLLLLNAKENEQEVTSLFENAWNSLTPNQSFFDQSRTETIEANIFARIHEDAASQNESTKTSKILKFSKRRYRFTSAAAAVVLVCLLGLYFLKFSSGSKEKINTHALAKIQLKTDLPPAGNKAVLTLANGKKITLDDASNGKIANQHGVTITKTIQGQLTYTFSSKSQSADNSEQAPLYNTISTPRGGKYQIKLPDGSSVWLNAASSLKFPTQFSKAERVVELQGEAYFEIVKSTINRKRQSFEVILKNKSGDQRVEVLGTHFNINAYENELFIRTTLLEGKVQLFNQITNSGTILLPGQQAISTTKSIKIDRPDVSEVLAWKNGNFIFNNLSLVEILRQIERWYDVDVDYNHVPNTKYNGFISRDVTLTQVLEMLELTGSLKFHLEGSEMSKQIKITSSK